MADSQLLLEVAESQLRMEVAGSQLQVGVAGKPEGMDRALVEVANIQRQAEERRHIAVAQRNPFCFQDFQDFYECLKKKCI